MMPAYYLTEHSRWNWNIRNWNSKDIIIDTTPSGMESAASLSGIGIVDYESILCG